MSNPLTPQEAIEAMKICDLPFVSADMIAPCLRMDPSTVRLRVREGTWDQDKLGKVIVSPHSIKFCRKDFLQKIGEIPPDKPEKSVAQLLDDIREELHGIGLILLAQLSIGQIVRLDELVKKEEDRQRCNADGTRKEINHE